MKIMPKASLITVTLAILGGMFAFTAKTHAQGAVATISGVAVSGGFDYTIILTDTGGTALNSFWYGWTTTGNNLPSVPTTAGNTLGWGNSVSGNSIEWVNSSGTTLNNGQSGTFTFFSTATPTAITTSPSGESVAYVNGIDFSQGLAGHSTPVFSPTLVAAPEPSATMLLGAGAMGLLAAGWVRVRK